MPRLTGTVFLGGFWIVLFLFPLQGSASDTHQSRFYSLTLPQDWEARVSTQGYGSDFFQPPLQTKHFADLRIRVNVLSFSNSLEDFDQAVWRELIRLKNVPVFEKTQLGKYPAHQLIYDQDMEDAPPKRVLRIYTLTKGKIYEILFSCDSANFDGYLPSIKVMAQSFKVK